MTDAVIKRRERQYLPCPVCGQSCSEEVALRHMERNPVNKRSKSVQSKAPMISRAAIEAAKKAAIAKAAEIDQTSVDTLDEESYRHLEAVLQAGLSAALAAGEMALVPVEPTETMLAAGRSHAVPSTQSIGAIYRAMLKAAGASDAGK